MNENKLGQHPKIDEQRDAIHVAIIPMAATKTMKPGEHVEGYGIVDPFLVSNVKKGDTYWLCLKPGSITSLRHDWTHPKFPSVGMSATDAAKNDAKTWIAWLAGEIGHPFDDYDSLIAHVESCMDGGDHFTEHGHEHMRGVWYQHEDEFWKHYETLTGKKKPDRYMPVFCCTC